MFFRYWGIPFALQRSGGSRISIPDPAGFGPGETSVIGNIEANGRLARVSSSHFHGRGGLERAGGAVKKRMDELAAMHHQQGRLPGGLVVAGVLPPYAAIGKKLVSAGRDRRRAGPPWMRLGPARDGAEQRGMG